MDNSRRTALVWTVVFFFSGFCGLIYEVVWFKHFSIVWGSSGFAIASVVASFLGGIGIGALMIGGKVDGWKRPLHCYGLLEISIGLLGLLVPLATNLLNDLVVYVYPILSKYTVLLYIFRVGVTFILIGPSCMLMGATLPLCISYFSRNYPHEDLRISWFYFVNTLGAAIGCICAGFFFLPVIGFTYSNYLAAILNVLIGTFSLCWSYFGDQRVIVKCESWSGPEKATLSNDQISIKLSTLMSVAFLTGCGSLALQMIWSRCIALILGGSTYSFSATLSVLLLGIAFGSWVAHKLKSLIQLNKYVFFAWVFFIFSVSTTVGYMLLPRLCNFAGLLKIFRGDEVGNMFVSCGLSAVIVFVPSFMMGMFLPVLAALSHKGRSDKGGAVGRIYAINTLGAIAGATLWGLYLLPRFGINNGLIIVLLIFVVCQILLLIQFPPEFRTQGATLTLLSFLGIFLISMPMDPRDTNMGKFMYGYSPVGVFPDKLIYFREGMNCNVLVTESHTGGRSLRVNGKVDASTHGDMDMQLGLAYFPRFLNPRAEDVLVIGFGSGTTVGASLAFTDTRVTCCEIEESVYAAAKYFSNVNRRSYESRNFNIIFDDARAYIQGSGNKYDLILSEPSNPWIAGVTSLFTKEFYQKASYALRPNGVFAQWIQAYSFDRETYLSVIATSAAVFGEVMLVRISDSDWILLCCNNKFDFNQEKLSTAQALVSSDRSVSSDLIKYFGTDSVLGLLVEHAILSDHEIRGILKVNPKQLVIADADFRLEFATPFLLFSAGGKEKDEVINLVLSGIDVSWSEKLLGLSQDPNMHLDSLDNLIAYLLQRGDFKKAIPIIDMGRKYNRLHGGLLQSKALCPGQWSELELAEITTALAEVEPQNLSKIGAAFWSRSDYQSALTIYSALVEKNQNSATALVNLGVNQEASGDLEAAKRSYNMALKLDPMNSFAIETIRRIENDSKVKPDMARKMHSFSNP